MPYPTGGGGQTVPVTGRAILVLVTAVAPLAFAGTVTIRPDTLGTDQHGNPLQLHGLGMRPPVPS